VAGFCEHDNGSSYSVKAEKFRDRLSDVSSSIRTYSMELAAFSTLK
jgi:hypothetical protein